MTHVQVGQSMARDQRMRVHEIVDRDYADYAKIFYLGSSAPEFALFFSNSEAKFYYSARLEKQFPNAYFYDPFTSQVYDWYNNVTLFEKIRSSRGDRVVFAMPASTFRQHAGASTRAPSTSTTQTRQALIGVSVSR